MSKFSKYQNKKNGLLYPLLQKSVSIDKLLTYPGIAQNFTPQANTVPDTTVKSNDSGLDEAVAEWVAKRKQKKELESEQTNLVRQENKAVPNLENVFKPLSSNTSNSVPTLSPVRDISPVLEETDNTDSLAKNTVQSELDDNKVKEQIRYYEGSRRNKSGEHVAYLDSRGNKTIGYGRLWKPGDPNRMSEEQAIQAFDSDYNNHKEAAKKIPGYDKASPEQKSALINLTYNMGGNFYKKFPNFTKAMESGNYGEAADHLKNSKWFKQVGKRGEDVVGMIRGSKVPKAKFGGYIYKSQSGGFNMDFLKNIAGNWKNYMKDPFSQQSESYINDLVGRNKSALTTRTDIQKQLILPDQNYSQWGDSADAAYTQKIWDDKYASQYGKKWNELDTFVQEGIWKDHKYKRPGLFNDDKLGGDLHESGKMFDKDRATRSQLGEANKTFNNQLLETGSGIFSLMNAQREYDNKPQEKFALDYTDDKGILRSQKGGSIPTSPLGLYKYPGQVVNVPGNDITMKGINEPVLAYPNNDKPELMLPGQNYKFPNSTNVVEVPMSQQGGNTNNSFNMLNKKYGRKVMSYQSGAPTYQGASPRILPAAPILPMGIGVKPKDLEENVKPVYGKSLVDAYKEELKSREEGFDYYKHYMTKGNNNEAFGALIGKAIGNKRERNKLAKLQDQQDKLDEAVEQKASMQSALNKGLNAYRDKQGDQIAAQFRDKNGNLKEVAVGNTANPATRNFVEKLDTNGTVPGTDVTPANTVASKANSSSGSNSSNTFTPKGGYYIPGENRNRYDKDADGNWYVQKDDRKTWVPANDAAKKKLDAEAEQWDGSSNKSKTSGSSSSGSSSKFKSPLNTSELKNLDLNKNLTDVNQWGMDAIMENYYRKKLLDGVKNMPERYLNNELEYSKEYPSIMPMEKEFEKQGNEEKLRRDKLKSQYIFKDPGIKVYAPGQKENMPISDRTANFKNTEQYKNASRFEKLGMIAERDPLSVFENSLATSIPIPIAGKAVNIAGKKVVEVGGQYVDDLGRYVSKKGDVLGKAPKEVVAKTKEFFNAPGKALEKFQNNREISKILKNPVVPKDYGTKVLPKMKQMDKIVANNSRTLAPFKQGELLKDGTTSIAKSMVGKTKNKILKMKSKMSAGEFKKVIDELKKIDPTIKYQAGGSTFSRENLFNHYYNNM